MKQYIIIKFQISEKRDPNLIVSQNKILTQICEMDIDQNIFL
jgi:hypothetical protein